MGIEGIGNAGSARRRRSGFTLVELFVVIAIIAVLMSVLMPALQKARLQATGAVCLGNHHTLALAYLLYSEDNDGRLVGAHTGTTGGWVGWPMSEDGTVLIRGSSQPDGSGGDFATLEDRLRGLRAGKLYPYIETTDVFHCPGDRRIMDGTYVGSTLVHRLYRTYSIQLGLNYQENSLTRMSEIDNPGATYAFVEEYYDGWVYNVNGGFILNPIDRGGYWWSTIAIWHGDVGTLGFVDGHAEKKKWVDERTLDLEYCRTAEGYRQPDNPDLRYMFMGYAIKGDQSWMQ